MTDATAQPKGVTKPAVAVVYADLCQHVTPPIVSYLLARYPIVGEAVWFEIVVLCLASVGGFLVRFSPNSIVDQFVGLIQWYKAARARIKQAADQP